METKDSKKKVVNLLSSLIAAELKILGHECDAPNFNPDVSDDRIKQCRINANELRRLRTEFENLMFARGMM